MSRRRSLEDALSPTEREFLDGPAVPGVHKPEQRSNPHAEHSESRAESPVKETKHETRNAKDPQLEPIAAVASLNTRIKQSLDDALLNATMDRKRKRLRTSTKRQIVEEALSAWLEENGYL